MPYPCPISIGTDAVSCDGEPVAAIVVIPDVSPLAGSGTTTMHEKVPWDTPHVTRSEFELPKASVTDVSAIEKPDPEMSRAVAGVMPR
jgi:hypothetical protein